MGYTRNRKTDEKIIQNRQKIRPKPKTRLDNKTEKPLLFSTKTENRKPDAKKREIRKPQRTPNPKNRSLLAQKTDLKKAKTAKPKIPMSTSAKENLRDPYIAEHPTCQGVSLSRYWLQSCVRSNLWLLVCKQSSKE